MKPIMISTNNQGVIDVLRGLYPSTLIGLVLVVAGLILIFLPLISQYLPSLEKIPWILLWTYKTENFVFITSPILIIITIISLVLFYIQNIR